MNKEWRFLYDTIDIITNELTDKKGVVNGLNCRRISHHVLFFVVHGLYRRFSVSVAVGDAFGCLMFPNCSRPFTFS